MSAKKKPLKSLADYEAEVRAAVLAELEQLSREGIRSVVRQRLTDSAFDLVTEALGLSKKWGRWEVDHCNGLRNAAADTMLEDAKDAAKEWLKEQAGALPALPKASIKALHSDYLDRLHYEIGEMLRQRACVEARRHVEAMFTEAHP